MLENFVYSSENLKNLNINPRSFGLGLFLKEISIRCEFFEDDPNIKHDCEMDEKQFKSYMSKQFSNIEIFL